MGGAECGPQSKASRTGLIEMSARYLFKTKVSAGRDTQLRLIASFYEVYNENVYDLMDPSKTPRSVRHNTAKNSFYVPGLVELECLDTEDVAAIVTEGRRARRRATHKLNRDSSRGHALLSLKLVTSTGKKLGKVNFVDLAGNERLARSQTENASETGSINKSLFALGKVISSLSRDTSDALVSPGSRDHIPYRDSTLTKLLMDSLGGDVFTLMIACVSPAGAHLDETLCTLQYAHRAKGITNAPSVQLVATTPSLSEGPEHETALASLRRENARLREENRRLRAMRYQSDMHSTRLEDDDTASMYQSDEAKERAGYEMRFTSRSRRDGSVDGTEAQNNHAESRVDYLDTKLERLTEHFANLEAKLDAAHLTKSEVIAMRQQHEQLQWHHAHWQAAIAAQQHQRALLLQQQEKAELYAPCTDNPSSPDGAQYPEYDIPHPQRTNSSQQQRRWREVPSEPHLCAVHRQSTGDVVRRHREGIGI